MSNQSTKDCALQLTDIIKDYGQGDFLVHALKGVSLNFRKNEFVSILGPSGCGKTTLLNIIGGLDRYTSGDLIIEGRSTKNYTDKDWNAYRNNCIGFIFQSYNLIPHQTVLANVELALELSGVSKKERKARALAVLEKVGLKEQVHKKPNQLSGGQMQRVAIARALINDPEIILADEPTGALDTETSVQVMDLLKEVAKDRLVIMVTHNPELAQKYSTRIIKMLDGNMVDDTNPLNDPVVGQPKKMRKPRMGFKTAFALSLKNLFSKRARTILTSIAGSIGIMGVALVLALSNGFNVYMARMQTDTLATYPLTISESSVDLSTFTQIFDDEVKEKYPELDNILVEKAFSNLTGMLKTNDLTNTADDGFLHYLEQTDENLYYDIQYDYGFNVGNYMYTDIKVSGVQGMPGDSQFMSIETLTSTIQSVFEKQVVSAIGMSASFIRQYIPTIIEMPNSDELINSQYDVLNGHLPTAADEIVFVVDEYNGISDISLALLGYLGVTITDSTDMNEIVKFEDKESISLEELLDKKLYIANNEQMYSRLPNGTYAPKPIANGEGLMELKIVGVLRPKEKVSGILTEGFAYSSMLVEKLITDNKSSGIVVDAKVNGNKITVVNPATMEGVLTPVSNFAGGKETPSNISIYAKDFESKEQIKAYIDTWNDRFPDDESKQITYSDMMSMMFGMLGTMVNAVTYVLIAFTSVSLIVSSVMIGIITYISVVERTKEIGVLRAMGASKGEISNVFNAETLLIGFFAGLIGVCVTYLLSIPINLVLGMLIPDVGNLAALKVTSALLLVGISITLTLISGLIPARIAAKKDPVVALRTE